MRTFNSQIKKTLRLWSIPLLSLLWSVTAQAQCVDFLPLADNTMLGSAFMRAGYQFQTPPGTMAFVNDTVDINGDLAHGVQFPALRVRLPAPSMSVAIEIGVFNSPFVTIRGIDSAGAVVAMVFVPADDTIHDVALTSLVPIESLRITGGGNEAVIDEICM
jgi:hypothetical protein